MGRGCIVPGCTKKGDRRYPGPQAREYYCKTHGKEVFKRDEPKKVLKVEEWGGLFKP